MANRYNVVPAGLVRDAHWISVHAPCADGYLGQFLIPTFASHRDVCNVCFPSFPSSSSGWITGSSMLGRSPSSTCLSILLPHFPSDDVLSHHVEDPKTPPARVCAQQGRIHDAPARAEARSASTDGTYTDRDRPPDRSHMGHIGGSGIMWRVQVRTYMHLLIPSALYSPTTLVIAPVLLSYVGLAIPRAGYSHR